MNPLIILSVLVLVSTATLVQSQTAGVTTRYWDCCKASCSWSGKASVTNPVETCAANGVTTVEADTTSACGGGGDPGIAYMCNNQQPYVINSSLSFGFAAAYLSGESESDWCCGCYELTFTSSPVTNQIEVVQVTNTGADLGNNQFDLQIPGGGVGIYNGCTSQWGAPSEGWGAQYGGVSSVSQCSELPSQLQAGCQWRFGWFQNANNPNVNFRRVQCPNSIVSKSNCRRDDDSSYPNTYLNL